MTAAAIAGELSMPLFTILLDGVINKYMGESAAKLRLIFDSMHHSRGVYFFDEVDALATARGNENDVGEARRSEEHTSELQSLMRISYAVFCLKKNTNNTTQTTTTPQ